VAQTGDVARPNVAYPRIPGPLPLFVAVVSSVGRAYIAHIATHAVSDRTFRSPALRKVVATGLSHAGTTDCTTVVSNSDPDEHVTCLAGMRPMLHDAPIADVKFPRKSSLRH
jgi:hypothetical protein